jgi:hypothetical protein
LGKLLVPKLTKNSCHVGILKGFVIWPLAFIVKPQWANFLFQPIKLLESFVCSTNGHSMKHPQVYTTVGLIQFYIGMSILTHN